MPLSPRVRIALAASAIVVSAVAMALPWYSSYLLETGLQQLASEHAEGDLRIRNVAHAAGWLHSAGSLDLEWHKSCAKDAQGPTVLHLQYRVRHVPDMQGWMRLDWSATPSGESASGVLQPLRGAKLTGTGHAGLDGSFRTDMQLPALALEAGGETLELTPSRGRLAFGNTALRWDWALERMAWHASGKGLEAKQIALRLELKNRTAGSGRMVLDIDSVQTKDVALQGLQLRSETSERADRLDATLTGSVRSAQFMAPSLQGSQLQDLVLEAQAQGLHTASVQTLGQAWGLGCDLHNAPMEAQQHQQQQAALKKLLLSGFSVGLSKLQGGGKEGGLEGKLMVTLAPAQAQEVLLARQLSTSGHININGTLMPPEQKAFALSSGYVQEVPDGVQASFDFGGGILKVNGKPQDTAMLQLGLHKLDGWLKAFLAGESLALPEEEPPLVPPSEAPQVAPAAPQS